MKKIIAQIMCILLLVLSGMVAFAEEATLQSGYYTSGYYSYFVDSAARRVLISGVADNPISGDIIVPTTFGGYPVVGINALAFQDCSGITSVTVTNCEEIYWHAFHNCDGLKTAIINGANTIINYCAFEDCDNLETVTIGNGVKEIGKYAFLNCRNLTTVKMADTVTRIGGDAFEGSKLTDVYYEGSKTDWEAITILRNNESLLNAKIHYNSSFSEPTPPAGTTQTHTATFDIWPSTGKSTINKVQGTGTIFYFTVITPPEVSKISFLADKFEGAEWHEISFDYLKDNYFLDVQTNSENQKVWTCSFDIHEVGYRTFKLMIDGVNTGIEAHVTVTENRGSFSPTPGQWQDSSDSTPPTIRVLSPIQGIIYREYNDALCFQITAEDASGIEKIDVYKNGYYYDGMEGGYLSFTVPMNYVDDEWNIYQIVATDKKGNQKTQDHYVYIPYRMTMYAPDGRTISIFSDKEYDWEQVGWYSYPVMYVYAPDGRNCIINAGDVYAWENVGWYRYPVINMYAPDGRCIVVNASDRAAWESVGWYAY